MPQDQAMPASADAPGVRQQKVLDELLGCLQATGLRYELIDRC
jgi:hypothetical protein